MPAIHAGVYTVAAALICLIISPAASAYIGSAQRAAAHAAAAAAQRHTMKRPLPVSAKPFVQRVAAREPDRVVKRWTSSLCKPANPCPLDEKTANTFRGGSYAETILSKDTILYRNYHLPSRKFGAVNERFSYWSRNSASGTQAVIDRAIDVSRYGNRADRIVAVRVPKGTRVYEGATHGLDKGAVGGGNQVILDRVRPEWKIRY
ncbi:hypothetical protein [Nitrosomonas sp. wSCUT-2]